MENKEIVLMDNETVVLFADFVEQKKEHTWEMDADQLICVVVTNIIKDAG